MLSFGSWACEIVPDLFSSLELRLVSSYIIVDFQREAEVIMVVMDATVDVDNVIKKGSVKWSFDNKKGPICASNIMLSVHPGPCVHTLRLNMGERYSVL